MTEPVVAAAQGIEAADWRAAVRAAAQLLVEAGAAKPAYADACVSTVEEHGPYIVLTRGLALAHARPDRGAVAAGLAAVTLATPVEFGHPDNDPVDVVLAFSAADDGGHVAMLAALARRLQNGLADRLRAASDDDEVRVLLEGRA